MNPQGTLDWYTERWGMITMSQHPKILLEGHVHTWNKLLKHIIWQREHPHLIREEFERETMIGDNVPSLQHGKRLEIESVEQYELTRNVSVIRPGFMRHHEFPTLVGSSVDFIETDDGTLDGEGQYACEIKCPFLSEHHLRAIRYGMAPEHVHQTQGHMEVTGLVEGKFVSYDPRHPVEEQRVYVQNLARDPEWSKQFRAMIEEFAHHLEHGTQFEHKMGKAKDGIPSMF